MMPASSFSDSEILAARGTKNPVDPLAPYAFLVEPEHSARGAVEDVATIFLTNRECPFHCLYCDLWKNTTDERIPVGAIPTQIDRALAQLPPARHIKLYNSGNFFDAQAIPPEDYAAIATRVAHFDTVIVENHPKLCGRACVDFRDLLRQQHALQRQDPLLGTHDAVPLPPETFASTHRHSARTSHVSPLPPAGEGLGVRGQASRDSTLTPDPSPIKGEGRKRIASTNVPQEGGAWSGPELEVALGLETVHPDILPRLNKRMSLDDFRRAAEFLRAHEIAVRAFILLKPPYMPESECVDWALRSLQFAFDCGARVCAVIPTRGGNGIMERLTSKGAFAPPRLESLERVLEGGLAMRRGRVFVDLWDVERFFDCPQCGPERAERLREMNLGQRWQPEALPACACRVPAREQPRR